MKNNRESAALFSLISNLQTSLKKAHDLSKVLSHSSKILKEYFPYSEIRAFSYESGGKILSLVYSSIGKINKESPLEIEKNHIIAGTIKSKKLLVRTDNLNESMFIPSGKTPKLCIHLPIKDGSKINSIIEIRDRKRDSLSEEEQKGLSLISDLISDAVTRINLVSENGDLVDAVNQRAAELSIINSVGEAMSRQLDIQTVTKIIGDKVRDIFKAEATEILLLDQATNRIHIPYSFFREYQTVQPFDLGEGLTSKVINTRKPLVLNTLEIQKDYGSIVDEAVGEDDDTESYMGVPIIIGERVIGVVSVQSYKQYAFNDHSVKLLSILSSSMGVAIENAHLFDETKKLLGETQQRNAELGVINTIQEGLVAQMDIQGIYDLVGDQIRDIFDAQVVSIGSYDYEKKLCIFKYDIEKGHRFYDEPRKFNAIDDYIIKTRQIFLLNENVISGLEAIGLEKPKASEGTEMPKSAFWVPLIVGEKVLGHVSLQNIDREFAFSESDVRLLSTLANSMSVALENARLFDETTHLLEETKQQAIELKIINSVGEGLAQKMDYQAIVDLVGDKIRDFFSAQVVSISTYLPEARLIHHRYVFEEGKRFYFDNPNEIDPDRMEIIDSRKPLIFNTSQEMIAHSGEGVIAGEMPKSYMGVPLILNQQVTGVITVQDLDREYLYSEKDVRLLMTLASNMGVALENARLFEETVRLLKESQQRNAELSILNAIQQGLVMEMDFQAIINLVGDKLREALDFQDIGIRLYDKQTNLLHFPYEYEHGQRLEIEPMPPTAISEYVLLNKKMLLLKKNNEVELKKLGLKGMLVIPGTDWSKSLISVPIILGEEARGLIMIENYEKEDAFNDSDTRLLMTLANSMSVALENARLFNETQQRNAELSILNAIQQGLVMEMDFQGIINLVGDKLREALGFQDIGIRIYDKETNLLHFPYEYEHGERLNIDSSELFGVSKYVIKNKKMILVKKNDDNTLANIGVEETSVIPGTDRSKSLIAVPIMSGEEARGIIIIENYEKEDAFRESDVRLLTTLSNSMSMALENARLFNETNHLLIQTRQRAAELSTVNSITQALASHLELDKLINLVGDKMRELFNANIVYVAVYDKDTKIINFPYGYGDDFPPMMLGEGLTSQVIKTGEPLLMNKKVGEKTAELGIERVGIPSSSYLGVPIPLGKEIIGVLSVQSTEKENRFSEEDLRLLTTIATNVGLALNNAEAYRQLNLTVDQLNNTLNDLKATQKQLIVQEKLASLGQLTAGIAHEIKNPLNFVNNFAEVSIELINELRDEFIHLNVDMENDKRKNIEDLLKDLEDNSNRINQHGKRADSIVKSMLQHSRGKAGERQDSDINAMLEEDINLAYHGMRARDTSFNVTIVKDFDKSLEKLSVIPQDISRVFLNIINNGFYEANKKKKSLKSDFSPIIKVSTHNFADKVEVRIRDNGNGIPLEIRDKLFNPFFTTKPTGEGTGLGLSLSHDIVVKQHEGDIRFESESGKFTEFIISLPKNGKRIIFS